ncbi:glycosyltransferase family 4 protein [Pleurocapsales cyanobacterium LEGE 10410]|nr:glycosyltransferase family 4 protein [Pleurocapsales cyanobacterium LEGE 10410]
MRILLVIHEELDLNSGAAGSTLRIGEEYQKLGHEVQYYSFDNLSSKLHRLAKEALFSEFVAAHIYALLRKQQIDVIDASTGDIWLWAKLRTKLQAYNSLLVTRSHGLEHLLHLKNKEEARRGNLQLSWKYPLYRGSLQLSQVTSSLHSSDLVYLLNRQEAEYVVEHLGVKPSKVHIFPNGIPESFLKVSFDSSIAEDSVVRIAQIGTYIPRKGILYSVPALNKILAKYPQVHVSFLGTECRECPDVKQIYADFHPTVRDRVKVVPRYNHEELPNLLRGHHIKLFPTISEAFGKALVEGMACGLAPITTSTGGPMEIVHDGHDAIVISPHDSQAIEQSLIRLIEDKTYLESLRRNAYATAQKYSWQHIAKNRLSVYEKELKRSKNV